MDKRTFIGMVEAGEPLIQQAIDAMRDYYQAQDRRAPPEEVERLRLLAESLFHVVSDYQLRVVAKARGKELPPLHQAAGRSLPAMLRNYTILFIYTVLVPHVLPSRSTPRAWRGLTLRPPTESPTTPRGCPHR